MNQNYAYIRVSTKEQNAARQIEALKVYCKKNETPVHEIFTDQASGKDFQRPQYIRMKKMVRKGDLIIVKELDRLGRDMEMIKDEWHDLVKKGADIVIIDTPILNTRNKTDLEKTLIANIVFELLTYMAEKERTKIKTRQAEGIQALRDRNGGKGIGRPKQAVPKDFIRKYKKFKAGGFGELSASKFAKMLGMSRTTMYKYINQMEGKEKWKIEK